MKRDLLPGQFRLWEPALSSIPYIVVKVIHGDDYRVVIFVDGQIKVWGTESCKCAVWDNVLVEGSK